MMFAGLKIRVFLLGILLVSAGFIPTSCSANKNAEPVLAELDGTSAAVVSGTAVAISGTGAGAAVVSETTAHPAEDTAATSGNLSGTTADPTANTSADTVSSGSASVRAASVNAAGSGGDAPAPAMSPEAVLKLAEEVTDRKKDKVIETYEDYDAARMPLLSSIPEKSVYLYGVKEGDGGVVLYAGEKGYFFKWTYITPRFVLPQMAFSDFDKDGKEELSVILYVGSGTGVSIEELYILELPDKKQANPGNDELQYYQFLPEDYVSQLEKAVRFQTAEKKGELTGQITIGGKTDEISLEEYRADEVGKISNRIVFGSIARFRNENGALSAEFGAGMTAEKMASPVYIGTVSADVDYSEGGFQLKTLRFVPNPEG